MRESKKKEMDQGGGGLGSCEREDDFGDLWSEKRR